MTLIVPEVRVKSHKRLAFATETKILDTGGEGIVQAIVNVSGNRDEDGDVVVPGASAFGLNILNPKGARFHDEHQVVAKTLSAEEVLPGDRTLPSLLLKQGLGGLRVTGQYNLKTQAGSDAYEHVKFFGDEQEWSVGYEIAEYFIGGGNAKVASDLTSRVLNAAGDVTYQALQRKNLATDSEPSRFITQWVVYEWSDVMFGANAITGTESVKSSPLERAVERIVVKTLAAPPPPEAKTLFDQRLDDTEVALAFLAQETHADMKAGRVQAQRNETRLRTMMTTMQSMLDELPAGDEGDTNGGDGKAFNLISGRKVWVDEGIEGTYEDTMEDIREAAAQQWGGPDVYISLQGSFPTHAIIGVCKRDGGEDEYYDVPWTYAEDGETVVLGTPVPVELIVTVTPSNEADDQGPPAAPTYPKSKAHAFTASADDASECRYCDADAKSHTDATGDEKGAEFARDLLTFIAEQDGA